MPLVDSSQVAAGSGNFPKYNQSSVPSSPANGDTWRELDATNGFPINIWQWESANSRWIDYLPRFVKILHQASGTGSSTSAALDYPVSAGNSILVDAVYLSVITSVSYSSTNKYIVTINKVNVAGTSGFTSFVVFDLQSITTVGSRVRATPQYPNTLISDTEHFNISVSISGSAGNIRMTAEISYRSIRA